MINADLNVSADKTTAFDVLVVDDGTSWIDICTETLQIAGYMCDFAIDATSAIHKLETCRYRLICMNLKLVDYRHGQALLQRLDSTFPETPVIIITGYLAGSLTEIYERVNRLQELYTTVKKVLLKGNPDEPSDAFINALLEEVKALLGNPSKAGMVSWLHLSDLHVGCKKNRDWESLKKALLDDLEEHKKPVAKQLQRCSRIVFRPDMLFITGDISYQAKEEEYDEAEKLLKSIWEITGLGKEQTFVVPGNHDVNRKTVENDPMYASAYTELANREMDEQSWLSALNRWWGYEALHKLIDKKFKYYRQFIHNCTAVSTGRLYYAQLIQVSGVKVGILGLNSALISWKNGEDRERGLWIGKPQLDEIERELPKDTSLRIALVHHPREAINEHDIAWDHLQKICSLLLHGHMHELRAISMCEPEREHICLPGGSVHEGGVWRNQRYSYGQFNLKTRQLDLYLRMTKHGEYPLYIRDNQTYPDAGADGHIRITLRKGFA